MGRLVLDQFGGNLPIGDVANFDKQGSLSDLLPYLLGDKAGMDRLLVKLTVTGRYIGTGEV